MSSKKIINFLIIGLNIVRNPNITSIICAQVDLEYIMNEEPTTTNYLALTQL